LRLYFKVAKKPVKTFRPRSQILNVIEEKDEELSVLNHGLSGSGEFLGLYIIRADLDEEKNRMNVTVGNSLPLNSIIGSTSLKRNSPIHG